jgi:hypothetical protein
MNTLLSKAVPMGISFLLIFLSGFWLSRSGKPYPGIIFNIHKFIVLGTFVYLALTVNKIHAAAPLSPVSTSAIVITVLCFAGMMVTGGLLSINKPMPAAVSMIHKLFPYSTLLSTSAAMFFLLIGRKV